MSGSITAQLFSLFQTSPSSPISLALTQPVFTVTVSVHLPLCLYSPQQLQASRSILVPLCPPCLAVEVADDLALAQRYCSRAGLGAAAALVPELLPGNLLSQCNLLTICFSVSYTILASNPHIFWDSIGSSLCSSKDQLGVLPACRGKWTLVPSTLPPSSNSKRHLN